MPNRLEQVDNDIVIACLCDTKTMATAVNRYFRERSRNGKGVPRHLVSYEDAMEALTVVDHETGPSPTQGTFARFSSPPAKHPPKPAVARGVQAPRTPTAPQQYPSRPTSPRMARIAPVVPRCSHHKAHAGSVAVQSVPTNGTTAHTPASTVVAQASTPLEVTKLDSLSVGPPRKGPTTRASGVQGRHQPPPTTGSSRSRLALQCLLPSWWPPH